MDLRRRGEAGGRVGEAGEGGGGGGREGEAGGGMGRRGEAKQVARYSLKSGKLRIALNVKKNGKLKRNKERRHNDFASFSIFFLPKSCLLLICCPQKLFSKLF